MISKKQKDRFRKLGVKGEMLSEPWLNLWIRPDEETEDRADDLYADLFPLRGSKKHKNTFRCIVSNLVLKKQPLQIALGHMSYQGWDNRPESLDYKSISPIVKILKGKKFLKLDKGFRASGFGYGVCSLIEPTQKLYDLFRIRISIKPPVRESAITLKGFSGGISLPKAVQYQQDVIHRSNLLRHKRGFQAEILSARYKDNDVYQNGRIFGGVIMNMPKDIRQRLQIDGEDVAEIDIVSCMPYLMHSLYESEKPPKDIYSLTGCPRSIAKKFYQVAVNTNDRTIAKTTIFSLIKDKKGALSKVNPERILNELENKAASVSEYFYKGLGVRFMRLESHLMTTMLEKALEMNEIIFPVHDSIICRTAVANCMADTLQRCFSINELIPDVTISSTNGVKYLKGISFSEKLERASISEPKDGGYYEFFEMLKVLFNDTLSSKDAALIMASV